MNTKNQEIRDLNTDDVEMHLHNSTQVSQDIYGPTEDRTISIASSSKVESTNERQSCRSGNVNVASKDKARRLRAKRGKSPVVVEIIKEKKKREIKER